MSELQLLTIYLSCKTDEHRHKLWLCGCLCEDVRFVCSGPPDASRVENVASRRRVHGFDPRAWLGIFSRRVLQVVHSRAVVVCSAIYSEPWANSQPLPKLERELTFNTVLTMLVGGKHTKQLWAHASALYLRRERQQKGRLFLLSTICYGQHCSILLYCRLYCN